MAKDNMRGVLAGQDKNGQPLVPVSYRPVIRNPPPPSKRQTNARNRQLAGFGPHAAGLNNNLTLREYQHLGGPPLAPRGRYSRVITNFVTQSGRRYGKWFAEAGWLDIVSVKGVPFLHAHLKGIRVPKRDIAGVRPAGRAEALAALKKFVARMARRL
jgi:hypothetical protein